MKMNTHVKTIDYFNLLERLVQYSNDIILYLSKDFKILAINQPAKQIYGWGKKKIIGKNYFDFCKKTNISPVLDDQRALLKKCKPVQKIEQVIQLPNGVHHEIAWTIRCVVHKKNMAVILLIGRDLSKERLLERQKDAAEIYLDSLISQIPEYVFWKNTHSVYLGCNDLLARVAGLNSREEILGKTDEDFGWNPVRVQRLKEMDEEVVNKGIAKMVEEEIPLPNSDAKSTMITYKAPLKDKTGNIIGILGISVDITDRKLAEKALEEAKQKAEQASEAKSQFIANMSHDLRTPLNGILGVAQVLEMDEIDPEKKKYIEDIINSSQRLTNLLNETLEISQIESGKLPIRLVEFEPKLLMEDMYQLFKSQTEQKGVRLLKQMDEKIPDFILGDKHRLHRILLNLIGNAVKFTHKGYVKLSAKCKAKKGSHVILQFKVRDSGIGIPENKFDAIFEKFTRLDPAYKGQYQGVGLGLGIVKQMIEEIGGNISVKSTIGKGSTFICTLPFEAVIHKEQAPKEKTKASPDFKASLAQLKNLKILLVEDDKICQRVIQGILKGTGFSLDIADSVSKARKLLKEFKYDIIFMDIGLPDGDGIEFTKEIRKKMKIKTPIIATTAHVGKERKSECIAAGMNEYIAKPVHADEVKKALITWASKKTKNEK